MKNKPVPCPSCGTKDWKGDNLVDSGKGFKHCFACSYTERTGDKLYMQTREMQKEFKPLAEGKFKDLGHRSISKETCEQYNYTVCDNYYGNRVEIANYPEQNAQKLRYPDKSFPWINYSETPLFGSHLCTNFEAPLIITEGEIDAMSIYEAFSHYRKKAQACSVPSGSDDAEKSIKRNLDWVLKFNKIILWFDDDDSGKKALKAVSSFIPLGKLYIVNTIEGCKDANDVLRSDEPDQTQMNNDDYGAVKVMTAIKDAEEIRPEGLIYGSQIDFESLLVPEPSGVPWPYPILNDMIKGRKPGAVYLFAAGTGCGKSTLIKECALGWIKNNNDKVLNIFLEERQKYTAQSYIGMQIGLPVHAFDEDPIGIIGRDRFKKAYDATINNERVTFYDHFGSLESSKLFSAMEYLLAHKGYNVIILDHISIAISGMTSSREGERRDIDILMTKLKSLAVKYACSVIAITHLTRPKGEEGFENGKMITLNSLRGSGALGHLSDVVIGLERDTQSMDKKNRSKIRVIKNRIKGTLGEADTLYYMEDTGRLKTIVDIMEE